jgi:nicotinate-nucleotide adenylyltransferase
LCFPDLLGIGVHRCELSNRQRKFACRREPYDLAMSPRSGPRRIGVLGGTFDPPHVGHLVTAIDVGQALALDVVLLVVANEPWQKADRSDLSPAPTRLAMVRAAVEGVEGVEASDLEIRRGGPTYTVDTLDELRSAEPDAELFLILGADAAAGLDTWHDPHRLDELCRIVVVDRPGATATPPAGFRCERVEVPRLDVSSSDLRARVANGRSVRFLTPDAVVSLIRDERLYGDRR